MASSVRGFLRWMRLPLERKIWLQNVGLWLILSLILSGGLFVALQMAAKGRVLYSDLLDLIEPRVPRPLADALVAAVLIWPLFLPSGVLWLALYWSVLLWAYGSLTERVGFLLMWLVLGVTPLSLNFQQRSVQLALIPPARATENLANGRLYGAMFSDLSVLRALVPESPGVIEMVADLHRRFDQWDEARALYNNLALEMEQSPVHIAAPLNNLGVFHLRKKDYGTAVNYFLRATEADHELVEAFYNLSLGHSQLFDFSRSNDALEQAKWLDRDRVEAWQKAETTPEESGAGVDGGVRRASEIQAELRKAWRASDRPPWSTSGDGISRCRSPPRSSCSPVMRGLGYRPPLGYDPGDWLASTAGVATLSILLLARLGWELRGDRSRRRSRATSATCRCARCCRVSRRRTAAASSPSRAKTTSSPFLSSAAASSSPMLSTRRSRRASARRSRARA